MRAFVLFCLVLGISSVSRGNVSGRKSEIFGAEWRPRGFAAWITSGDALITPDVSRLAVQACLRDSQAALDIVAFETVNDLLSRMRSRYRRELAVEPTSRYDMGLAALTTLLDRLNAVEGDSPEAYREKCEKIVTDTIRHPQMRDDLELLYLGRMRPVISPDLSQDILDKLASMAKKGIRLAPLTWEDLRDQICVLEGYYGTSPHAEHWKLFSTTRAMANVLPQPAGEALFKKAVERAPEVVGLIGKLNRYSSVAGKPNGPSIGSPQPTSPVRLTGPALGTKETALMALFTTGWREALQRYIINQNYPEKPFELISSGTVLGSLGDTYVEVEKGKSGSQTEWGMAGLWQSLFPDVVSYGEIPDDYRKTAALAWLARNAEANIRQNEKLTGYEKTSDITGMVSAPVYGPSFAFIRITQEIDAALDAYRAVDAALSHVPACIGELRRLNAAAAKAVTAGPGVGRVPKDMLQGLKYLTLEPVIADIGLEVKDESGDKPEGTFRLHLGTGYGHEVPVTVDGHRFTLWTQSAVVLHADGIVTTAKWQAEKAATYDPITE